MQRDYFSAQSVSPSVDPPRPPRDGFEWVWFPEGYWAEREPHLTKPYPHHSPRSRRLGFERLFRLEKSFHTSSVHTTVAPDGPLAHVLPRKSPKSGPSGDVPSHDVISSSGAPDNGNVSPMNPDLAPSLMSRAESIPKARLSPQFQTKLASFVNSPRELYTKAKHKLGSRMRSSRVGSAQFDSSPSASALAADGAVSADRVQNTIEGVKDSLSTLLAALIPELVPEGRGVKLSRKVFGRAPWSSKDSFDTDDSVTSSLRNILAGRTPVPSSSSTTRDGSLLGPVEPNFPASEAQRLPTPPSYGTTEGSWTKQQDSRQRTPLSSSKSSAGGQPCAPSTMPISSERSAVVSAPPPLRRMPQHMPQHKAPSPPSPLPAPPQTRLAQSLRRPASAFFCPPQDRSFDFGVPYHLPGSPQCPAVRMASICVYHGRLRRSTTLSNELALRLEADYE